MYNPYKIKISKRNICVFLFLLYINISAQNIIRVNNVTDAQTNFTIEQLVRNVLISGGSCSDISNVVVFPNLPTNDFEASYGYFNKANSNFPFQEGVLLTTGSAFLFGNTYSASPIGYNTSSAGDLDLANFLSIPVTNLFNSSYIQFDFVPVSNIIS